VLGSDRRSLSLTLSLILPDLNLTIFPSIPCLVSGRRSEPIIILLKIILLTLPTQETYIKSHHTAIMSLHYLVND